MKGGSWDITRPNHLLLETVAKSHYTTRIAKHTGQEEHSTGSLLHHVLASICTYERYLLYVLQAGYEGEYKDAGQFKMGRLGPNRYILLGVVVFQVNSLFWLYIYIALVSDSKQLMKPPHEIDEGGDLAKEPQVEKRRFCPLYGR